jgi:branched-chain amino acid transport system substrate-binding protein
MERTPGIQHFRACYPDESESGRSRSDLVEVLKCGGEDLTHQNVMKVVADLCFEIETSLPGNPHQDRQPMSTCNAMMGFTGETWRLFPLIDRRASRSWSTTLDRIALVLARSYNSTSC